MIQTVVSDTRRNLGMSTRDFAEAIGVSPTLVNFWELGRQKPSYPTMFYVYTHASRPELRAMAASVMAELDPARAQVDMVYPVLSEAHSDFTRNLPQ